MTSSPDQTTYSKLSRLEQGSFGELIPVQAAALLPEPVILDGGNITLYCADCLQILPTLAPGSVDAVITDPPYDAKTHNGARYGFRATSSEIPFAPITPASIVPDLLRVASGWAIAFCSLEMYGAYRDAAGEAWVRAGFWRRTNGVPQFTGDRPGQPGEGLAIMHAGRRRKAWNRHGHHAFWEYPIVSGGPHPTTKPLPLTENLVRDFTTEGETILDPFMGGVTTGVACVRTGRKFIGCEIGRTYFDGAVARIKEELRLRDGQGPLMRAQEKLITEAGR